jgi:hypothetical protein
VSIQHQQQHIRDDESKQEQSISSGTDIDVSNGSCSIG